MPPNQTATILGHLRRLSDADTPDGQLLRRFAAEGDETAFAALLQRHGRLVWGLCRRTLNHHDAEDAFQATFLVLARQAASIRNPEGFVSWLYGVAARIAFRARHNAARRQVVEAQAEATPPASPPAEAGLRELQVILEEEVGRLKTIYRMPFVLCCLEGKSKAEAAAELGWKEGSVSGRLARARERLRQRLARRGVTLPAALTAAALAQPASAAVPVALSHATLAAALSFGALKAAAGSLRAVSLAEGFLASVTVTRLALRTVALLLCALLVGGAGFAASWPRGSSPAETPAPSQPGKERPRQPEVAASLPPGALVRMGSTSLRHGSTVLAVALAPDGKTVAAASIDGRLCVWDTASGALLREWRPDALALAWSPDGKTLATGGNDRAVILWDVATGKQRRQLTGHAKRISALAYTADGSILASASADGIIRLWRPAMGKEIRRLEGHQDPGNIPTRAPNQEPVFPVVGCLAFAPDGKTLASGGTVGTARLWDVATGKEVLGLKGHTQNARRPGFVPAGVAISGVAFAPDGKTLATASYDDNTALLWDVSTGKPRGRLAGHTGGVHSVAFAPDGKTLATGGAFYDGSVWVWDVASGKERARMAGHTHGVYGLDFSKDGRLVASGGADGAVRLWDAATGRETSSGPGHRERINTLVYSPDGKTLATGSHDHTVRLWDAATGKELRCLEGHQHWVNAVAFSPDGKLLASGGYDGTGSVRFWDPVTGRELRRVNVPGGALALSFSPDGGLVAVRDNSFVVHVVDTATGGTQRQLKLPPGSTHCVVFSPDGKYLAADSGYAHCVVHLFETATGKEVYQFTGTKENPIYAGTLLFSPDGKTLALGGWSGHLRLWEVASGKERGRAQQERGNRIAFSADGRLLASGGLKDSTVRLWDVFALAEYGRFTGHIGSVNAFGFAPDGKSVASGGDDTTVLVWKVPAKAAPAELSAKAIEALWIDLAAEDAARAYRAVGQLASSPREAIALLRRRLVEALKPDPLAARWIADLDSKQFAVRDRAARELEKLGTRAEAALGKALAGKPSLEVRQRLERLLQKLEGPISAPETLRLLRAVEVLEHAGTAEAREVLEMVGGGQPGTRLGGDAEAALARLRKRPANR